MNQTLARSINTSLVAILPILAVLVLGADILGAVTLEYFGLALLIGLTSGAYSSIFIASPLLAMFKEHEQRYRRIRERLEARGTAMQLLSPAAVAAGALSTAGAGGRRAGGAAAQERRPLGRRRCARARPRAPSPSWTTRPATRSSAATYEDEAGTGDGVGRWARPRSGRRRWHRAGRRSLRRRRPARPVAGAATNPAAPQEGPAPLTAVPASRDTRPGPSRTRRLTANDRHPPGPRAPRRVPPRSRPQGGGGRLRRR